MASDVASPSLAGLEAWFVAVSTDSAGVSAGVRRAAGEHPVGVADVVDLSSVVTAGPRLSALERLAIYNDGYFARLIECLADDYPGVQHALGEGEFARLCRAYIDAHPSRSPSLNAYGASLESYLRTRTDAWAPFAAALARLEWALVEVIHAEAPPPLEAGALAGVAPEAWSRARLVPSSALRVLDFDFPVNAYYQAFREGERPALPELQPSAVAVHRSGLSLVRVELDRAQRRLLGELAGGATLAGALAALESELGPDELAAVAARLSGWFGEWIGGGMFVGLEWS